MKVKFLILFIEDEITCFYQNERDEVFFKT